MNIEEDLKICKDIMQQYKKLNNDDAAGAFELSKLSLAMYDRLNEIRINVDKIAYEGKKTKSDIKEYLRGKMKTLEYIHIESRAVFNAANTDNKNFRRY